MQVIDKKNYLPTVCCIYTGLVLFKLILENLMGIQDKYYTLNLISMFCIVLVATFILSLHYYLQHVPLPLVIIGQYLLIVGLIMGAIWIKGHFSEQSLSAYRDMFLSFTIPYFLLAAAYYIEFYLQLRKGNQILSQLKRKEENKLE